MRFIPSGVVSRRVSYVYPSPRKRIRPYNYTFVGLERSIIHGPGGRLFAPQCAFRLRVRGDTVEPRAEWTTDTQIMRETLPTVLLLHRCAFPPQQACDSSDVYMFASAECYHILFLRLQVRESICGWLGEMVWSLARSLAWWRLSASRELSRTATQSSNSCNPVTVSLRSASQSAVFRRVYFIPFSG